MLHMNCHTKYLSTYISTKYNKNHKFSTVYFKKISYE